jgi:dGTPase
MADVWIERRGSWKKQAEDERTPFDTDYSRIVHSASFRRLQGKTQILNLGDSDFYRTRLTHSLEVAQIAGGVVRQLAAKYADKPVHAFLPDLSLIQCAGFSHDLGHPPFGHGGEVALNYCMRGHGGFEGNGHTLRLLAKLENFSANEGSNLTRRVMLAILKYPVSYSRARNPDIVPRLDEEPTTIRTLDVKACKPPKCYFDCEDDVVAWVLKELNERDREVFQSVTPKDGKHSKANHKSFDCSIMDLSDDIAYGVHDLEDAITLGLIKEAAFRSSMPESACSTFLKALKEKYPDECGNDVHDHFVTQLFASSKERKRFIGRLVHHFVTNVEIVEIDELSNPLVRYRAQIAKPQRAFLDALQVIVEREVIFTPHVQHLEYKGQKMVVSVFEALKSDPERLLATDALTSYKKSDGDPRVICDYVAGMTDGFLLKTYDRLFSPRMGSVFDKL